MSTWFPRKDVHKVAWKIPGTNDTNQNDHILVSKRWAPDTENVLKYRGANSDSNHFLVGAKLKEKIALTTRNKIENRKRWNVDKFDDTDVERHYQQEMQQKLQRNPPSNDKGEEWMCIKETLITSAQDVIGEKHERNEEWYDQECRETVEVKRAARLKCIQRSTRANQEDYNRKRIAASRVCRRKKRDLPKNKVDEIVEHHTKN